MAAKGGDTTNNSNHSYLDTIQRLCNMVKYANISVDETLKDYEYMIRNQILREQHKFSIYYLEKEDAYRTYLPDDSRPNHRRPLKRKSKEELEQAIIDFYIEQQEIENRNNITLENLYKEWLIFRRDYTAVKPKTIQENVNDWNKFFKDTEIAKMRVTDIKPITLIRYFRKLTKDRNITYKRLSNARSVLNGIMNYAIEEELIIYNPVNEVNLKNFTYKPIENQQDNVFSIDDTITLLNYLQDINEPYSLAIQLSFYLFIRIGETKAIRIEDIDLENKTVYLHSQALTERTLNDDLTFSSRKVTVSNQMKGNTSRGFRKQYLTDEAIRIIHKAIALNPNGTFLFEPNGTVMTTDRFNRRLKKYCEECGIKYHSSHKIRFYNASLAYTNGTNLTVISKLMGHSQVATTLHYLRDIDDKNSNIEAFSNLGLASVHGQGSKGFQKE